MFLLGLFAWSLHILMRQKQAWSEFAKKNNLSVNRGKFFASVSVVGMLRSIPFYLFSEEQVANLNGGRRFRTIIQFELSKMPVPGIVASIDAANFANSLSLKERYQPEFDFWNKEIIILTDNVEALRPYFTEERCRSLNSLMTIRSIAGILIFDDTNTYLRFETPDPFDDMQKLDRFVSKAVEHAKILSV